MSERYVKIVEDPEKGPVLKFEGFKYLAEVLTMLGIGQEIVTDIIKKQMQQNSHNNIIRPVSMIPKS